MSTVRPEGPLKASSADEIPPQRLPLRWAVIVLIAGLAALASYPFGGPIASIGAATAVTAALHKMIA